MVRFSEHAVEVKCRLLRNVPVWRIVNTNKSLGVLEGGKYLDKLLSAEDGLHSTQLVSDTTLHLVTSSNEVRK